MFLNIITPCSRPQNLETISKSINIPRENYRWIVVFDSEELPSLDLIPENCEPYTHKDPSSFSGNGQRNFAIDKVESGFVYFNDDDTILHKDLYESIKNIEFDFLTFPQEWPNGTIRLNAESSIGVNHTDSHNFVVSYSIIGETRWELGTYAADGIFAYDCSSKTSPIRINKILSTYNTLR